MRRLVSVIVLFLGISWSSLPSTAGDEHEDNPYAPPQSACLLSIHPAFDLDIYLSKLRILASRLSQLTPIEVCRELVKLVPSEHDFLTGGYVPTFALLFDPRMRDKTLELPDEIIVPLLVYTKLRRVKKLRQAIPPSERQSRWSRLVNRAEIFLSLSKANWGMDSLMARLIRRSGRKNLEDAVSFAITNSLPIDSQQAARIRETPKCEKILSQIQDAKSQD